MTQFTKRRELHQDRCAWIARMPYLGRECIAALQFAPTPWKHWQVRQAEALLSGGCIDAPSTMPAGCMRYDCAYVQREAV